MVVIKFMRNKCKNSVFCIYFLIFFLLGTICGIFVFASLLRNCENGIFLYCNKIFRSEVELLRVFLFWLKSILLLLLAAMSSVTHRAVLLLVACRGFLCSFSTAAALCADVSIFEVLFVNLILLSLYFFLASKVYFYQQ